VNSHSNAPFRKLCEIAGNLHRSRSIPTTAKRAASSEFEVMDMRSVVLMHGLLRGMGREVPCELLAIKESTADLSDASYSRCSVIEAPENLPDGDYSVVFATHIVAAKKEGGLWLPQTATARALPAIREGRSRSARETAAEAATLRLLGNHVA
jgi:hypothetical protein